MNSKATLYLDSKVYRAIKVKAAHTDRSLSHIVNEALKLSLKEDALDLAAFEVRAHEPVKSYGDVLKDLKRDKLI